MAGRYLHHVTLTSGHARRSPRSEVRDDVVASLRPLVRRALEGERVAVPGQPGYTVTGAAHGRCCVLTVHAQHGESRGAQPVPVLTTGVAAHSRCGAHLWRILHEEAADGTLLATDPESCPAEPWCADRLELGAARHPEALGWTGDWSRCAAWTWIEMREGGDA